MKVICIDGVKVGDIKTHNSSGEKRSSVLEDCIYEGETYTVFHECNDTYILFERSPFNFYPKKRFIPLSTIDETELHSKTESAPELIK